MTSLNRSTEHGSSFERSKVRGRVRAHKVRSYGRQSATNYEPQLRGQVGFRESHTFFAGGAERARNSVIRSGGTKTRQNGQTKKSRSRLYNCLFLWTKLAAMVQVCAIFFPSLDNIVSAPTNLRTRKPFKNPFKNLFQSPVRLGLRRVRIEVLLLRSVSACKFASAPVCKRPDAKSKMENLQHDARTAS